VSPCACQSTANSRIMALEVTVVLSLAYAALSNAQLQSYICSGWGTCIGEGGCSSYCDRACNNNKPAGDNTIGGFCMTYGFSANDYCYCWDKRYNKPLWGTKCSSGADCNRDPFKGRYPGLPYNAQDEGGKCERHCDAICKQDMNWTAGYCNTDQNPDTCECYSDNKHKPRRY